MEEEGGWEVGVDCGEERETAREGEKARIGESDHVQNQDHGEPEAGKHKAVGNKAR